MTGYVSGEIGGEYVKPGGSQKKIEERSEGHPQALRGINGDPHALVKEKKKTENKKPIKVKT
jgi:hypothetical protein